MPDTAWVVAHRGHSAAETENSPAALDRAVAAGADAVEGDVRIAGDGVPVVSHDPDLSRIAGRSETITATPSDRLDALAQAAGASLPRLTTLMTAARGRIPLMLDVKETAPAVIDAIAGAAEATGLDPAALIVGLRSPDLVPVARDRLPTARLLALNGSDSPLGPYLEQGVTLVRLWESGADALTVGDLKRRGCTVWVTTGGAGTERAVGDCHMAGLRALLAAGADGLLVNDPDLGRRAVDG